MHNILFRIIMLIKKRKSFKKILPGIVAVVLMVFGLSYFIIKIRRIDKQVFYNTDPVISSNVIINKEIGKKEGDKAEQTIFSDQNFKSLQTIEIDTKFATGNPNIFK